MDWDGFYLGGPIDPATGDRNGGIIDFDPDDLTTHGVIVGMTGSGKTGLGIIYIEEALRRGIPTLVIDPKGDMTNLLLTFPDLLPSDFEPWMDDVEARRQGKTVAEMAAGTAALWTKGLAGWELGGSDIGALRDAAEFTIYTPGSRMGVPLNLVGSLRRPDLDWDTGAEALRDEIQSFVSGLLGLVGIDGDPISSREHVLLSNLIEHGWRAGLDLDLETLLAWVQQPPLRKLGVFDIDSFFPAKDRRVLALTLNGLIASPSFASWIDGDELDAGSLLWTRDGRPRASIFYLAHLSDEERQFVVATALSRLVTWMRQQPGTGGLRALVYMDEAFGFAPQIGEPPAKRPILTILKQARAFGVGMLVSTQNPMDLDYKAMSNAGTWNIGRLQTERDKARILEGLASARGGTDVAAFDKLISGLGKRQFVLHSTRRGEPDVFTTRWAMSYLRGPLTGPQITRLVGERPEPVADPSPADAVRKPDRGALAADETRVQPPVAEGVPVRFADPAAPWGEAVGMDPTSTRYRAVIAATLSLRYDDTRAGVDHREQWEAVVADLTDSFDAAKAVAVDHDPRDFTAKPAAGASFVLPEAPIDGKAYFRSAESALKDHLDRTGQITILRNRSLSLYSRVGETREEFESRCNRAASDGSDRQAAKLRDKYETRLERAHDQFEAAQRRADEIAVDLQGAKRSEWTDVAGTVIDFLSGRRSTRRAGSTARQRATVRSKEQRLRSARDKAADREETIEDLEDELVEELDELAEAWEEKAGDIEELEIGLERADIAVDEIFVVWIPV
jgi:DNA helicase HerA-like ATPase